MVDKKNNKSSEWWSYSSHAWLQAIMFYAKIFLWVSCVVRDLSSDEEPSLKTSMFPLSFQVMREPLPFAYLWMHTYTGNVSSR